MLYTASWVAVCGILVLAAMARTKISLFKVSVLQVFFGLAFIMSFVGYPILYFHLIEYRVAVGITDKTLIACATLASSWAIVGVILSYWMLGAIAQRNHRYGNTTVVAINRYRATPILMYWCAILGVSIAVALIYLSQVDNIALVEAVTGGNVATARSGMTNDFPGKYHWYRLFFYDFSWIATLALYAIALVNRTKLAWGSFVIALLCTMFFLAMTAQKAPIVFFFATLFLVYAYLKTGRRVMKRHLLMLVTVSLVAFAVMYLAFMGSLDILSALSSTFSRALTGQLSGAYNYLWIFPGHIDYLMGRSFPNPGGIFPFEHFPLTKNVMAIVHPQLAEQGIVGSQPTMYWGEAYANFGWIGVLVAPLYVGFYIFVWKCMLGFIKTVPMKAASTVWVGFHLGTFAYSGLGWSLVPVTLVAGFFLFFLGDRIARIPRLKC